MSTDDWPVGLVAAVAAWLLWDRLLRDLLDHSRPRRERLIDAAKNVTVFLALCAGIAVTCWLIWHLVRPHFPGG